MTAAKVEMEIRDVMQGGVDSIGYDTMKRCDLQQFEELILQGVPSEEQWDAKLFSTLPYHDFLIPYELLIMLVEGVCMTHEVIGQFNFR